MEIVSAFLDHARQEYGIEFPDKIKTDGLQHRYKMPHDKGCSTSGFVTFHMDDNPLAVFGDWKEYGAEIFKWFYRDQRELTKRERDDYKSRMKESLRLSQEEDKRKKLAAAYKASELWQKEEVLVRRYEYLDIKRVGAYGVKFFDAVIAFDYFATDERKEKRDQGEIKVYPGPLMVVPVQNQTDQLVSLQQISRNGKFKGFLPDGMKKGCFHVIHGHENYIFVCEGYATGASIFELTGCTVYIAFDCGNLEAVCMAVKARHKNAIKIIASDDDRKTLTPIKNPGQTKANSICSNTEFHNLKPEFASNEDGTDWNDLTFFRSAEELKARIRTFIRSILHA